MYQCSETNFACELSLESAEIYQEDVANAYPGETINGSPISNASLVLSGCPLSPNYDFGATPFCYQYDPNIFAGLNNVASSTIAPPSEIPLPNANDQCPYQINDQEHSRICFEGQNAMQSCTNAVELQDFENTNDRNLLSPCMAGQCRMQENACYTFERFSIGDGEFDGNDRKCGDEVYLGDNNGDPYVTEYETDNHAKRNYAIAQCNQERLFYFHPDNEDILAARPCVPYTGGVPVTEAQDMVLAIARPYEICFNAEGLRRVSDEQVAQILEDAEAKALADSIAASQDNFQNQIDAINNAGIGGSGGGLVPECTGQKWVQGPDPNSDPVLVDTGCGWLDFVQLINNLIAFAIWAAAIIVVLAIFIAGFKMVTAQGNPGKIAEARNAIFKAVGGFCVVLLAWLLVSTFMNTFLDKEFQDDDVSNLLENQ